MIDIFPPSASGLDLGAVDTQTAKAGNILSVQQGALEYEQDLGVDLSFFLTDQFVFQNESFKAYLIQRLAYFGINVSTIDDTLETLYRQYTFNLVPEQSSGGLVAR
jgi:hypothetical protein